MSHRNTAILPFLGLGFDLAHVERVATVMAARWTRPARVTVPLRTLYADHAFSGFELLVSLSREIRGR